MRLAVEIFSDTQYDIWSIGESGHGFTEKTISLKDKRIDEYIWGSGKLKIKDDYTYFGGLHEVRNSF